MSVVLIIERKNRQVARSLSSLGRRSRCHPTASPGVSRFSKSVIRENEKTLGARWSRQGPVEGPTSGEQNLDINRSFSVQTMLEINRPSVNTGTYA